METKDITVVSDSMSQTVDLLNKSLIEKDQMIDNLQTQVQHQYRMSRQQTIYVALLEQVIAKYKIEILTGADGSITTRIFEPKNLENKG